MKTDPSKLKKLALLTALSCASLHAAVTIKAFTSSASSPQPVGTPVTFTVTATDTSSGPLTFQFSDSYLEQPFSVIRNFNVGTLSTGVWTAQPFVWDAIDKQGANIIQVIAKDFKTGETATLTVPFTLTSLVPENKLVVVSTPNPLVALAAVPSCPSGSSVRVFFGTNGAISNLTPFYPCRNIPDNIYIGGLYAESTYTVGYQILTGSTITAGINTAKFTTGSLPASISFPSQTLIQPPTSQSFTTDKELLHAYLNLGTTGTFQPAATDLSGNINWFYNGGTDRTVLLTRPLPNGHFLLFQSDLVWSNGTSIGDQAAREVDLAGTIVKETNIGLLQQQLVALGDPNLQSCANVPIPAPVGSACLTSFSHDFIKLPNGYYAVIGSMEKIFPPGTQGDKTGLNVDILGDAIIVINNSLNAVWYFDTFEHDGGGNQLSINRPAVLGETCGPTSPGCPALFLAGTAGVTAVANDWLHSNSLQYRPSDADFILSSRHQDWVMKIDYNNGTGTSNILWRLGLGGDFTFNNINDDPYPWFSHQHDAGFELNGVFDCFDNGNTRISVEGSGNSRGIALSVNETALTVTPVISQDLGYYGFALGSAQLLSNGNYHFQPGVVQPNSYDYSIELAPVTGTTNGTQVYNLQSGTSSYRSFRIPSLYEAPTT